MINDRPFGNRPEFREKPAEKVDHQQKVDHPGSGA
jgi:hypothetical protein